MKKTVLFIRDFPPILAERVLSASGEKVLTRAVLKILYSYFELQSAYNNEKLKRQDLQSDFDVIMRYFRAESDLSLLRKKTLDLLSDPNRFYLHGD